MIRRIDLDADEATAWDDALALAEEVDAWEAVTLDPDTGEVVVGSLERWDEDRLAGRPDMTDDD